MLPLWLKLNRRLRGHYLFICLLFAEFMQFLWILSFVTFLILCLCLYLYPAVLCLMITGAPLSALSVFMYPFIPLCMLLWLASSACMPQAKKELVLNTEMNKVPCPFICISKPGCFGFCMFQGMNPSCVCALTFANAILYLAC